MQVGGITLILVLAVMGGLIAYCADLLGRALGKRRLTIGHMRPKHTAALLTTLAGVLIPLFTIGLMTLLFSDVREMLFRTQAIKAELAEVETELKTAQARIDLSSGRVAELQREQSQLQRQQGQLKSQNQTQRQALQTTRTELARSQRALRERTQRARQLLAQAESLRSRNAVLQRDILGASASLVELRDREADARALSKQVNERIEELNRRQQDLLLEIDQAERNLALTRDDLTATRADRDRATQEFERLRAQLNEELERLRGELRNNTERLSELERAGDMLMESLGATRTQPILYQRGQEVLRWMVPAQANRGSVQTALTSLLQTARVRSERMGARSSETMQSVDLLPLPNQSIERQREDVIRAATSQDDPVVLLAIALLNSFRGEPVPIQIRVERNSIVYRQGQVIAETRIDGAMDESRILEAIGEFVRDRVATKAIADRMIPAVGTDAPLGEVNEGQIFALMRELRQIGRPLVVQAIAAAETRRADRLRIEFRLR